MDSGRIAAGLTGPPPPALDRLPPPSYPLSVPDVTVYSTEPCSFCRRVKGLLDARGVQYAEVNLAKDPVGRAELAQRTGMMSFPQVCIDGELLGGFAELEAAANSGRLDELLTA